MRNLFLSILAVGAAVAVGCSKTPPAAAPSSEPAPKLDAHLMIEPVPEADKYLRLLDVDGYVFKFSGGLIECWLEETIGDQPMRRVIDIGQELRMTLSNAKVNKDDVKAGFVVVTRRRLDQKELWDLKLVVEQPGQGQLGVKLTGATAGLWENGKDGAIQGFSVTKQGQEVTGETTLITAGGTSDAKAVVRLKCAPMTLEAR